PTTYLVDTTLSNSSDSDQTVQAVRLRISDVRGSTSGVFSSITETGSVVFISPGEGWIFISWRTLTPGIDEAIQPS
ncbi:hypothetical protein ACOYE2_05025, partial [Salmonella enterica subsp. enterica]|uniref:hypothetical protein n=1 Tax=Salmonella enterica TaxID=28901 RepID=UPI003BD8B092